MQIALDISNHKFNEDFKGKINQVKDLNKYINVLPKSIQIYSIHKAKEISFIEHLFEAFDKSITFFNEINCYGSASSSRFLSRLAKKVRIKLNNKD